jgi:hypothetical protein
VRSPAASAHIQITPCPPNRYFDDPRSVDPEMLLVVGKGSHDIQFSSILIGETPVISLGVTPTSRLRARCQPR